MDYVSFSSRIKRLLAFLPPSSGAPRRRARRWPGPALLIEWLEQRDCPSTFNGADLLVVSNNSVYEYTVGGNLVQQFTVDYPGQRPAGENARGIVVNTNGLAYVFNGTASPYLGSVNPGTMTWNETALTGDSVGTNAGYGELGSEGQFIFAPNMSTPNGGIVRFDTTTASSTAFVTATAYSSVTVGPNDDVYALEASAPVVDVYDPNTLHLLQSVTLSGSPVGLAVDAAGDMYTADSSGVINQFSSAGALLNSLNPEDGSLVSVAVAADGQLLAGTAQGDVVVTTTAFTTVSILAMNTSSPAYVTFVDPQQTPPSIISGATTTFATGSSGSFTIQSIGAPTPALSEVGTLPAGVTFVDNGNGTATLAGTPAVGTGGVYTFTITAGNGVGTAATQSFTLDVASPPTFTIPYGTNFTLGSAQTFTLATGPDAVNPTLTVTGNLPAGVTFVDNGNGTATLSGTPSAGTAGTYPLTITAQNEFFSPVTENFTLTVLLPTVTTLSVSTTDPVVGRPVTLTASVAPATGKVTLSGTVTFYDGNTAISSAVRMINGKATFTTTTLDAGTHSLSAEYNGNGVYGFSASAALTEPVTAISTQVLLSSSSLAPVYGQPLTFSVRVNPLAAATVTPTGTVTFFDGSTVLGTVTLSDGAASLPNQTLSVGTHLLTAQFTSSNPNESNSTSGVLKETIGNARASVALSAAPAPAVVGEAVTLTAAVTVDAPGADDPGGTVTFAEGVNTLGTGTVVDGVATLTTSSLSAGIQTFFAYYGGDSNTTGANGVAKLRIDAATTTVSLASSPTAGLAGQTMTLTAQLGVLAPGVAVPTGTVAFFRGSLLLGTAAVSNGTATFTTPKLSAGTYNFSAHYSGNAQCLPSDNTWAVTVDSIGHGTATVALSSSADPSTTGTPVAFTATVTAVNPSTDTPTGTVSFYNDGVLLGSANLSSGAATLSSVTLPAGTHSITASYAGDSNFAPTSSPALSQVVQVGTTTALSLSTLTPVVGQPITISARVSPTATTMVAPAGTVTFMDGATVLGTASVSNGLATLSNQVLAVGANALTAVFASTNTTEVGSTSAVLTATIAQARTTITLVASPSPAVFGQAVTLTANIGVASPGSANPSGTVTFTDGLTTLGTAPVSNGVATLVTTSLPTGLQTLTASYSGDANTTAGTGGTKLQVNLATTTVSLNSSPSLGVAGQTITLSAQVTILAPGAAVPTNTVAFFNGAGQLLGTGTVNSSGLATFTTQKLAAGTYTYSAKYSGNNQCTSSYAAPWTFMMINPPVANSVTLAPSTPLPDGTITATVAAVDPQNLPLVYTYVWSVNGTTVQVDSNLPSATDTLAPANQVGMVSGNTVAVSVTAYNGLLTSHSVNALVTVAGPVVTGVGFHSNDLTNTNVTSLTAMPSATDSAGATITCTYQWYLNGVPIVSATGATLNLTQVSGLAVGSSISVVVVPTDSSAIQGLAYTSNPVVIAAVSPSISLNVSPPVVTSATLASANGNDAAGTVSMSGGGLVNATVSGFDPQSLGITYTFAWYVDGLLVETDANLSSTSDQLNLNDMLAEIVANPTLTVVVTACDGLINSSPSISNTLSITA